MAAICGLREGLGILIAGWTFNKISEGFDNGRRPQMGNGYTYIISIMERGL